MTALKPTFIIKNMTHQKTPYLHDHYVKQILSRPEQCVELLSLVLSKQEMDLFDWSTLKIEATSLVDQDLKEKRMDVLFSVRLKNSDQTGRILFIGEHKSGPDPKLLKQFLFYITDIYRDTRSPVIPVFINQSEHKVWKGPLEFHDYLQDFTGPLREFFKHNVLNFRLRVLNIQALDLNNLPKNLTIKPFLYILKHIRAFNKLKLQELIRLGAGLKPSIRDDLMLPTMEYVYQYNSFFTWRVIKEEIKKTLKKKEDRFMAGLLETARNEARQEGLQTGRQEGLQTGRQEGLQEGRQEVVLNMLQKKADISFISEVTGVSEQEIKKLKNGS